MGRGTPASKRSFLLPWGYGPLLSLTHSASNTTFAGSPLSENQEATAKVSSLPLAVMVALEETTPSLTMSRRVAAGSPRCQRNGPASASMVMPA
jgi:hypothetical protein